MKIKTLSLAIACSLPLSGTFAAALDRSGQSIAAFLQDGNYFEVGGAVLDADVSGKDTSGRATGDMADSYHQVNAALKIQPSEHFSVALLFDQPFGADASYSGNNHFVSQSTDLITTGVPATSFGVTAGQGTQVSVKTQNISAIFGYQPNKHWNFYAGPVYQTIEGEVSLRGSVYSIFNGYDGKLDSTEGWGWLAGFAYQIPEIALKASLTYRSEIDHDNTWSESSQFLDSSVTQSVSAFSPYLSAYGLSGETAVSTPQSVNLDFQTGIMANTVAFANIRWVNWKDFSIRPYKFGKVSEVARSSTQGFNLIDYSKDQWTATVGLGRKLNDKWSASTSVGWDSGAGNPVSLLGPTEGYWNLGLGVQYSPAANYFVSGGLKYYWLGDADAQTGAHTAAGEFSGNHALAYGLKVGYRF
jgi:long-chain fatty acid transport protein